MKSIPTSFLFLYDTTTLLTALRRSGKPYLVNVRICAYVAHFFSGTIYSHHHQSVMPKGRSFTASAEPGLQFCGGQIFHRKLGTKTRVYQGLNRCGSFPSLSALFMLWDWNIYRLFCVTKICHKRSYIMPIYWNHESKIPLLNHVKASINNLEKFQRPTIQYSPRHEGTWVAAHERDGDNITRLQHLKCTPAW